MNKHSHVRSFLSVLTRPRAEPAVNDFPVVAWKAAEGKLRLLSLMCIYCRCLKLVASQYAICRTILPCVQLGNGLEPVRDKPSPGWQFRRPGESSSNVFHIPIDFGRKTISNKKLLKSWGLGQTKKHVDLEWLRPSQWCLYSRKWPQSASKNQEKQLFFFLADSCET